MLVDVPVFLTEGNEMGVNILRRIRDVFYVNAFPKNNEVVYYGMQLSEFIKYSPVDINQLLLLQAEYYGPGFKSKTRFEVVGKETMSDFLREDVYGYGNFCWVDFDDTENIEKLEPIEIAELLYLGHMFKPVNSPYFEKLQNRFAYLAHDDGYFCRLYCRQYSDFEEILANKIQGTISTSNRRRIYPLPQDIKFSLMEAAEDGLLIDFCNVFKDSNSIEIPIYCIGKYLDMSYMYNNLERLINQAYYSARLVHKKKRWALAFVNRK